MFGAIIFIILKALYHHSYQNSNGTKLVLYTLTSYLLQKDCHTVKTNCHLRKWFNQEDCFKNSKIRTGFVSFN